MVNYSVNKKLEWRETLIRGTKKGALNEAPFS